jgi:hypothetical protein
MRGGASSAPDSPPQRAQTPPLTLASLSLPAPDFEREQASRAPSAPESGLHDAVAAGLVTGSGYSGASTLVREDGAGLPQPYGNAARTGTYDSRELLRVLADYGF